MKTEIWLILYCLTFVSLLSCSAVRSSKFSAFNEFVYAEEQPRFNFRNDSLKIEGSWNWASDARAIPRISFIPKIPLQILRGISKENGSVLFATWTPNRTKYSKEGYVPVTKKDVQFANKLNKPFFIAVLINNYAFSGDTIKYKPQGRNNDYQFALYASTPKSSTDSYWVMEVIAAEKDRYYDFVCIAESQMATPELRSYQAGLFLEDIKRRFLTK